MNAGAKVLLVGSCFADEIGEKMVRGGFDAMVNPFGTLYNPASIAASLLRALSEKEVALPRSCEFPAVEASLPTSSTSTNRPRRCRQTDVDEVDFVTLLLCILGYFVQSPECHPTRGGCHWVLCPVPLSAPSADRWGSPCREGESSVPRVCQQGRRGGRA